VGRVPDRGNPVLRGDLRARSGSRKVWILQAVYLGILGALVFLGLPPELGRFAESHETSLYVAVLWVQVVLVTYSASACLVQEIAVEGEKASVDLLFAPFSPRTIITGKSLASMATIVFWLLLGLPLLVLTTAIRQIPVSALMPVTALIAVVAWGIAEVGLLYSIVFEAEFTRTLAHWATLTAVFVGTASLPPGFQSLNPIVATTAAARGAPFLGTLATYALLGIGCALVAQMRLRRMAAA
jgi:ABC-type transport system involved in multi-copper enzyme maturation permease subunit